MATKRKQYPSQARLRELFDYDPEGFLVWRYNSDKDSRWNSSWAGRKAGWNFFDGNSGQYVSDVCIGGIYYSTMILIWIYHKGGIDYDHYVKYRGDIFYGLKIENMFLTKNKAKKHIGNKVNNNTTGYIGVSVTKSGKFEAIGQNKSLGTYCTPEAAASAYDNWAIEFYGPGFIPNGSGCEDPEKYRVFKSGFQRKSKSPSSGFKGVSFRKRAKKNPWVAYIDIEGKKHSLGAHLTKEQAARAYNIAAYEHYGEHAVLNDIPDPLGKLKADEEDVF